MLRDFNHENRLLFECDAEQSQVKESQLTQKRNSAWTAK